MFNSYTKTVVKDNQYLITKVVEETTSHSITPLTGKATITHVGGNGRFKFIWEGLVFETEFAQNICQQDGKYYDYSEVEFDINIKEEWSKLYIYSSSKEYWKQI